MKPINCVVGVLLVFSVSLFSAESPSGAVLSTNKKVEMTAKPVKVMKSVPKQSFKHLVGFAAGGVTGSGISYRRWFKNGQGFQVNFFPTGHYESNTDDNWAWINLGVSGMVSLLEGQKDKFGNIGTLSAKLLTYYGGNYEYSYNSGSSVENWKLGDAGGFDDGYYYRIDESSQHIMTLGGGVGGEFSISHVVFSLLFGYQVSDEERWTDDYSDSKIGGSWERIIEVSPSVEGSIHIGFGSL